MAIVIALFISIQKANAADTVSNLNGAAVSAPQPSVQQDTGSIQNMQYGGYMPLSEEQCSALLNSVCDWSLSHPEFMQQVGGLTKCQSGGYKYYDSYGAYGYQLIMQNNAGSKYQVAFASPDAPDVIRFSIIGNATCIPLTPAEPEVTIQQEPASGESTLASRIPSDRYVKVDDSTKNNLFNAVCTWALTHPEFIQKTGGITDCTSASVKYYADLGGYGYQVVLVNSTGENIQVAFASMDSPFSQNISIIGDVKRAGDTGTGEEALESIREDVFEGGIKNVLCGSGVTAFQRNDGTLLMCGSNGTGKISDGIGETHTEPLKVAENVYDLSLGYGHTAVLTRDGKLWMSGSNTRGQLGDGTTENRLQSVQVADYVRYVDCGWSTTAIIRADDSLWVCGANDSGQLGVEGIPTVSAPMKIMDEVQSVSCGASHTAILKKDGSLWMCGANSYGQLGDGTLENRTTPVKVMVNVKAVSCGNTHTAVIRGDNSLWMFGNNAAGQSGAGAGEQICVRPRKIMRQVKTVDCSYDSTMVLTKDGTVWVFGDNAYGKLGNGSEQNIYTPVQVVDQTESISCGEFHATVKKRDGTIYMCGMNKDGVFGGKEDGIYTSFTPID